MASRYVYVVVYHDSESGDTDHEYFGTIARARRQLRNEGYEGKVTSYTLREDLLGSTWDRATIERRVIR